MENKGLNNKAVKAYHATEEVIDELINEIEELEATVERLEAEIEQLKEEHD